MSLVLSSTNANGQIKCGRYPTAKAIQEQLQNKPVKINYRKLMPICNVNDSIKNRLMYLLKPDWSKVEIENFSITRLNEHYKWLRIDENAKKIANGNDSLFKVSRDSIANYWKNEYKKEMKEYTGLSTDASVLQAVAYLDMKESVPVIKKYFTSYNLDIAKLALARLGNKTYQKEIIKSCLANENLNDWEWIENLQKKAPTLSFIGTQESIYAYNYWIDTSKIWHQSFHSSGVKAANYVLIFLKDIILNEDFQTKLKITFPEMSVLYDTDYNNTEILIYCKNWLIKNKGKYKIKRTFYEW